MAFKAIIFDNSSMGVSTDGIKIKDGEKRVNQQRKLQKKIVKEEEIQETMVSQM